MGHTAVITEHALPCGVSALPVVDETLLTWSGYPIFALKAPSLHS